MRLDKYLKVSRLIKRRTLANDVADAGRVIVNGKPAKASYAVKIGDVIEITFGNRPVKVRVLSIDEPKGKDVARELFEILEGGEKPGRGSSNRAVCGIWYRVSNNCCRRKPPCQN